MAKSVTPDHREWSPLLSQLRWLVSLRWVAGGVVIVGSVFDTQWMHWYPAGRFLLAVGAFLLAYNLVMWLVLRAVQNEPVRARFVLLLSWMQLLLDLASLTFLTLWTGGSLSPLLGFFVFHMVFASLLLPREMAYGAATAAVVLLWSGLYLAEQLPADFQHRLMLVGLILTLYFTVFLTNHVVRPLRVQRLRLLRKNHRIRSMTRQLRRQQKALIQHEKMVAMGQMAAGVAHEIANPLASMDSLLQVMQRRPERVRPEAIDTLRKQIDRINQTIIRMKNFAHPVDSDRQMISLNEVIDQALGLLGFDQRLHKVDIQREYDADLGTLHLWPQALQQVLVNLFSNALDAMEPTEQPVLSIRTSRRDDRCVIEVTDNGTGIAAENMDRLFEPFFTTKPVGKGTGLGLSISYMLVQKQGGSIGVRSTRGKGTTFTIRLPTKVPPTKNDPAIST